MSTENQNMDADLDAFFSKKDKRKKSKVITTEDLFEKQRNATSKLKKKRKPGDDEPRLTLTGISARTEDDDDWFDDVEKPDNHENDSKKYENLKVRVVVTAEEPENDLRGKHSSTRDVAEEDRGVAASYWKRTPDLTSGESNNAEGISNLHDSNGDNVDEPNQSDAICVNQSPKQPDNLENDKVASDKPNQLNHVLAEDVNNITTQAKTAEAPKKSAYVPPHLRNKQTQSTALQSNDSAAGLGWRERERLKMEQEAETKLLEPIKLRRGRDKNLTLDVQNVEEFPALSMQAMKKEITAVASSADKTPAAARNGDQNNGATLTNGKKVPRRTRERTISLSKFNKQQQGGADNAGEEQSGNSDCDTGSEQEDLDTSEIKPSATS